MSVEKHHCIPLACRGRHHASNIIVLSKDDHQLVHQVLNIPRRRFSGIIRSFRMKHNPGVPPTKAMIEDIVKLQREYFVNIGNLRADLLEKHTKAMYDIAIHECSLAGLHRPKRLKGSPYTNFWHYLDAAHNALRAQVK